ncbi:MAG: MerC domain-containing protein [Oligoflexales bacterium]
MKSMSQMGDQLSVGLSMLCAVHCFVLPVFMALVPSLQVLSFASDESFHFWMMVGVLPTSLATLWMGCHKHKEYGFLAVGLLGLSILAFAAIWGHALFGCKYEKYITLLGSGLISFAHIKNYFKCKHENCDNHTCNDSVVSEPAV